MGFFIIKVLNCHNLGYKLIMTEKNIKEMAELAQAIKDVYIRVRNILENEIGLGCEIHRPDMFSLNSAVTETMELYVKFKEIEKSAGSFCEPILLS